MRTRAFAVLGLLAGALPTSMVWAQTLPEAGIVFEIEHATLMPGQSTTVTLLAARPAETWAMADLVVDLGITTGSDGWSDLEILPPFWLAISREGTTGPGGIADIRAGKLNFPPAGAMADNNPIAFWQATYTAPVEPVALFTIDLRTATSRYDIYFRREDSIGESILDEVVEANATIRVVPAPASALVLAMGVLLTRTRRRN